MQSYYYRAGSKVFTRWSPISRSRCCDSCVLGMLTCCTICIWYPPNIPLLQIQHSYEDIGPGDWYAEDEEMRLILLGSRQWGTLNLITLSLSGIIIRKTTVSRQNTYLSGETLQTSKPRACLKQDRNVWSCMARASAVLGLVKMTHSESDLTLTDRTLQPEVNRIRQYWQL